MGPVKGWLAAMFWNVVTNSSESNMHRTGELTPTNLSNFPEATVRI